MDKKILSIVILFISVSAMLSCDSTKMGDGSLQNTDTIATFDSVGFNIPFQMVKGRVVVDVKLNGLVDVRLVVDNGCSELCLSDDFVDKYSDTLGLTLYPEFPSVGEFMINREWQSYVAEGDFTYKIGDSVFVNYYDRVFRAVNGKRLGDHAMVIEDVRKQGILPDGVDGIIPLRCLSKDGIIRMNFEKQRFEFIDKVDSSMVAYLYDFDDNKQFFKFPITFFGESGECYSYTFLTILDLGLNEDFVIPNNSRITEVLKQMRKCAKKNISSFYDRYPGYSDYYFKKIQIGKDSLPVSNIGFTHIMSGKKIPFDLLIGAKMMSEYDVVFDYKDHVIYLKPLSKSVDGMPYHNSILFGITIARRMTDSTYYTAVVDHDEKKVDIQLDDVILKVDNLSLTGMDVDSFIKLRDQKDGNQKTVTVKRGKDTLILHRIRK